MQVYTDAFIAYVDILGYKQVEAALGAHGPMAAGDLLQRVYQFLDAHTVDHADADGPVWLRYGDGYVGHADGANIDNLRELVDQGRRLLALALNQSVPLRIAITQDTLNVDVPGSGTTVSGPGWNRLLSLESTLDWMGGVLQLPGYDGTHHPTVESLIQNRQLVVAQADASIHFHAPFKQEPHPPNVWFLNWEGVLARPKPDLDNSVVNWWSQMVPGGIGQPDEDVVNKQTNTISFADYCRDLRHAAELVYHSGINRGIHL